jgi:hypothetical protein
MEGTRHEEEMYLDIKIVFRLINIYLDIGIRYSKCGTAGFLYGSLSYRTGGNLNRYFGAI